MVYCQNSQSKTKAVTLVFKREELLYDAENYSFVEGDIMQAEDEHARHQVFDIGQTVMWTELREYLTSYILNAWKCCFLIRKKKFPISRNPLIML